jgi:hypothetical protein
MLVSIASIRRRTQQEKSDIADTRNCGIYAGATIGFALSVQLEGLATFSYDLKNSILHNGINSNIMDI